MLQLANRTRLTAALMVAADPDGVETVWATVKGTFTLTPEPTLAERQRPVAQEAEFAGDPAASSMLVPAEVGLAKPGTDVLVRGEAIAPGGRPTTAMDVAVAVGPVGVTLRVVGDRWWHRQGNGYVLGDVAPFERVPLVWERAFGGRSALPDGERVERRNPIGCGFRHPDTLDWPDAIPAPNVEDPAHPHTALGTSGQPAGVLPIGAHWWPRPQWAGTYDEAWQRGRAPYLPRDFDRRFLHVAPPPLVAAAPLTGGEPIQCWGLTPEGYVASRVPVERPTVTWQVAGRRESAAVAIDTILLDPSHGCFTVCWRTQLRTDKETLKVRELRIEGGAFA